MNDGSDGFLSRWARRKAQVRTGALPPEPALPPVEAPKAEVVAERALEPAPADDPPPAAAPLPTLEDVAMLTRDSDYSRFVAPGVDGTVRNAAMKKLFADPHFNVMDRLDTYIDDYSKPDPIPAAMLRQMVGSKLLGLFDDEEEKEKKARDDADNPQAETVAQSDANPDIDAPEPVDPENSSQPDALAKARPSQDLHAHTDLRLQPDNAAPAKGAGSRPQ